MDLDVPLLLSVVGGLGKVEEIIDADTGLQTSVYIRDDDCLGKQREPQLAHCANRYVFSASTLPGMARLHA